jgi:hypothetical protein
MSQPTLDDKYYKRCGVMCNLITNEFKNDEFDFMKNSETLQVEVVINKKWKIPLPPDYSWDEIQKNIENIITNFNKNCVSCFKETGTNIACPECSSCLCGECYIDSLRRNKGIISCPECKYSIGEIVPDENIDMYITHIKNTLNRNSDTCPCGGC